MRSTNIFYGALLATTAFANPIAQHHFCWLPGESCSKAARSLEQLSSVHMKRAADAQHHFCWLPGESCAKDDIAKRDASPDAETVRHFCSRSGQPCSKLKRAANAVAEAMALPDAPPGPEDVNETAKRSCYGSGQPCALARRSALALAQGFSSVESFPVYKRDPKVHHFCWLPGQGCGDAKKRDVLAERDPKIHHFCWLPGQGCGDAKRDVLASSEALADIELKYTRRDVEYDAAAAQEYCDSEAGPCTELTRFAAAIVDAIAEPEVAARAVGSEEDEIVRKRCYATGGACDLGKRMVESLKNMTANY